MSRPIINGRYTRPHPLVARFSSLWLRLGSTIVTTAIVWTILQIVLRVGGFRQAVIAMVAIGVGTGLALATMEVLIWRQLRVNTDRESELYGELLTQVSLLTAQAGDRGTAGGPVVGEVVPERPDEA